MNDESVEILGARLSERVKRTLGRSLSIREVDAGSCNGCEIEVNSLTNAIYDIERFGLHIVASPRHADMLLITGPVTRNMEHALRQTYDVTPEPRLIVAMGACAITGGIFRDSYAVLNGVDQRAARRRIHTRMPAPAPGHHPGHHGGAGQNGRATG